MYLLQRKHTKILHAATPTSEKTQYQYSLPVKHLQYIEKTQFAFGSTTQLEKRQDGTTTEYCLISKVQEGKFAFLLFQLFCGQTTNSVSKNNFRRLSSNHIFLLGAVQKMKIISVNFIFEKFCCPAAQSADEITLKLQQFLCKQWSNNACILTQYCF